jgi:SPIRAL1-like protein
MLTFLSLLFAQDRPSTKVQAAPGGGSSLDYLFSGNKDGK